MNKPKVKPATTKLTALLKKQGIKGWEVVEKTLYWKDIKIMLSFEPKPDVVVKGWRYLTLKESDFDKPEKLEAIFRQIQQALNSVPKVTKQTREVGKAKKTNKGKTYESKISFYGLDPEEVLKAFMQTTPKPLKKSK